jgi:hypothetical protein
VNELEQARRAFLPNPVAASNGLFTYADYRESIAMTAMR